MNHIEKIAADNSPANNLPAHPTMVFGVPAGDAEEQSGRLLADILHALRRRWLLVAFLGSLLGAAAALGVYKSASDRFTARALIRIPMQREAIAFQPVGMSSGNFEVFVNTQRRLITSQHVLISAQAEVGDLPALNDQSDPLAWFESLISTSFSSDSELMEIRVTHEDRGIAETLLNAVVTAYLESAADRERKLRESRVDALEKSFKIAQDALRDTYENLDEARRTESPELTQEEKLTLELWREAKAEHFGVHSELQWLQGLAESNANAAGVEAMPADADPDVPVEITEEELDMFVEKDPVSQGLKEDIRVAEGKIERARTIWTPGARGGEEYIAEREAAIVDANSALVERREELRTDLNRQGALLGSTDGEPDSLADRIFELRQRESMLSQKVAQLQARLPPQGIEEFSESRLIEAEVEVETAHLESLRAQIGQMEVERDSPPRITQEGTTVVPKEADRKPRIIKAGAAGGAVFLFLGAGILLLDMQRRRVSSPDDFTTHLQLNVIGTLPLMRRSRRGSQRLSRHLAEAVDNIAAALVCGRQSLGTQAVMITSAVAGEGKTTLAANLATSLAGTGRRTLLVDFDLRRPMLHSVYDIERGPGVCEALIGEIEPSDAWNETDDPSLWVMPAGHWRERAIAQLADQRLQQLFAELRSRFDFIVVDASPVLPIVDARLIGKHVDGVILSLLRDVSEVPKVAAACRTLESFDVRILGGVMIGSTGEVYYGYPPSQEQLPESA